MSISTRPDQETEQGLPEAPPELEMLTAMEAVTRLLLDQSRLDERAGLNTGGYATGYPGSPLGGLQGQLQREGKRLLARNIHQAPGLNEETAATAVWGTQAVTTLPGANVDGVFALWYAKAPGVDRAADALRHANIRGAHPHGGVLVVAGDDPNANATVFPTDSTAAFATWGMPVLYPGSVQEILDLGHHGYALSRIAGLWVGFKLVTTVADGSGTVDLDLDRLSFVTPEVSVDGRPFHPTLRANDPGPPMREAERDLINGRTRLAEKYIELNRLNPVVVDPPGARIGIVAPGKTWFDVRQALDALGLDDERLHAAGVRLKKISALHPIGRDEWRAFAAGLDEVVVVEEKRPFLEAALKHALYGGPDQPVVSGKQDPDGADLFPSYGEFGPDQTARLLARRLVPLGVVTQEAAPRTNPRTLLPLLSMDTSRAPFFCSGCPHNTSLKAPDDAVVAAGIGCHIMSLLVKREDYGTAAGFTQMGGEGAQWTGQSPFTDLDHIFQNVGDGTFHHSASLALRLSVASGVNVTYKLLYNSAVGMTGGQDIKGVMPVPELTHALQAEGVKRIIITTDDVRRHKRRSLARITTVWPRDRLIEAQELLAKEPGVTVLLHDQQCAADKRRRFRRGDQKQPTKRIMVNERVCEGCGDCNSKSQCLSVQPVETEFGRKTHIHQSSCNFDYSCVKGDCPSFLTVETKDASRARQQTPQAPRSPAPVVVVRRDRFSAHMTGIGGTGVVSANEILATAAAHDGLRVRSLDLPGSSIKAGIVVSQLQVYADGDNEPAATIAPGAADLFLGFDLLGAMTPANIEPASPERTVVVGSVSVEPTGQMAIDPGIALPTAHDLVGELDARSRADSNVYLDVAALTQALFGDHMSANALLMGAAFQAGAIPFAEASMQQAFRESGVAVEQNLAAFAWGRAVVASPELAASLGLGPRPSGGGAVPAAVVDLLAPFADTPALRDVVLLRVEDLVGYQGPALARTYAGAVAETLGRERAALGDGATGVTEAYARGLHKLMAYKDEYEVARLMLLDSARMQVLAEFGEGTKVSWNLHPPLLRAMGMKRKLSLGPWFRPAFVALRGARRLRGTPLDPFGPAKVRRLERGLVKEYDAALAAAWPALTAASVAEVTELAGSPELVRGYEHVKLGNAARWCERVDELSTGLGTGYRVPAGLRALLGT